MINYPNIKLSHKLFWPALFSAIILKHSYYWYSYLPIVDDNNIYGIFRLKQEVFKNVFLHYKLYSVRPVAGLLDAYFWRYFWNSMGTALFLTTLLHFSTCLLIYKIFKKCRLNVGITTLAIFALLPFGSEATYWLSASTRIVVGLFFVSLSLFVLCHLSDYYGKSSYYPLLLVFFILHLVSLCFYEQVIALSLLATILVIISIWKRIPHKWIVLLPILNYTFILTWYKTFQGLGNKSPRGQFVDDSILTHFINVSKAVYNQWNLNIDELIHFSFKNSINIVLSDKAYIFIAVAILISICLYLASGAEYHINFKVFIHKVTIGILMFITPYTPFLLLKNMMISNRNIFLSFIGLGLIIEAILSIADFNSSTSVIKRTIISGLVGIMIISNVFELNYYRNLGLTDKKITSNIAELELSNDFYSGKKSLILYNAKLSYVQPQGTRLGSCTGADWALTGALEAHSNTANLKMAYPILKEYETRLDSKIVNSSIILGIDDSLNVFPLKIKKSEENTLKVYKADGREFGKLKYSDSEKAVSAQ